MPASTVKRLSNAWEGIRTLVTSPWGVPDPLQDLDVDGAADPRGFVTHTIDNSGFQFWVCFVAGVGFFTDAVDVFALNTVITIFRQLYPATGQADDILPQDWDVILLTATLGGICIGMFVFGILGDFYGRRKMWRYGLELIVLIVGSIASAMCSRGEAGSMHLLGWLIFWRVVMGIGIGADYPLSAVITSEFAPRRWRNRMLATVFWMQPVGQFIVLAIASVAVKVADKNLSCAPDYANASGSLITQCEKLGDDHACECVRQLDATWRAIVGVGAAPALVAIYFRMTIPPSPRYRLDVKGMKRTAVEDTRDFFINRFQKGMESDAPGDERHGAARRGDFEMTTTTTPKPVSTQVRDYAAHTMSFDERPPESIQSRSRQASVAYPESIAQTSIAQSIFNELDEEAYVEHLHERITWSSFKASADELYTYLWTEGNWRLLLGTAGTWLLLDIPYYGLGLSFPSITLEIWPIEENTLARTLLNSLEHQMVITCVGAVFGGAICIALVQYVSTKHLQFWSFLILALLLLVLGVAFKSIQGAGYSGLIVLYTIMQVFFQLGPNTTTYMIASEVWPTKFRCTLHGFSAAAGKMGAIAGQLIIAYGFGLRDLQRSNNADNRAKSLSHALITFFGIMLLGAILTWLFTPDTRDSTGQSLALETLSEGHKKLRRIEKFGDVEGAHES